MNSSADEIEPNVKCLLVKECKAFRVFFWPNNVKGMRPVVFKLSECVIPVIPRCVNVGTVIPFIVWKGLSNLLEFQVVRRNHITKQYLSHSYLQ